MKQRVLIVDDESDLAWMLKLNLERTSQYEVATETNPAAAVETARAFLPDVVLLDLIMPECRGGDLAAQIESALPPRSVTIIFLTAALPARGPDGAQRTIAGYRFLAKPVAMTQLLACLAAASESAKAA
jgi:two-component system alkaline phosphatase synthesis response regulator PhoP